MAITDNLRAAWKLDEASGNAADSSGNGYTLTNNNTVGFAAGKINNGADFGSSNTNKYFKISSTLGIATSDDRSFNVWIKPTTHTAGSGGQIDIFEHGLNGGAFIAAYLLGSPSRLNVYTDAGSPPSGAYTVDLADGNWHMLTVTRVNSTRVIKAYIDGIEVINFTSGSVNVFNQDVLSVGMERGGSLFPYFGMQDEFSIWNRVITTDEISQLYNSGRANAYPQEDSPNLYGGVAYWKFDESSGNATDSINSNTLTNNNSVGYSAALINNGADFTRASSRNFSIASGSQKGLAITGNAITINVWHKGNSNLNNVIGRLFWRLGGTGNYGYQLSTTGNLYSPNNAYLVSLVGSGGGTDFAFGTAGQATDGTRRMITATYDGTNIKCYVDGTLVSTSGTLSNRLTSANAETFYIGRSGSGDYLDGQVDEGSVFNRALSDTEIAELYNGGAGLTHPFTLSSASAQPAIFMGAAF